MPDSITAEHVWFYQGSFPLIRDVSLSVQRGDIVAITGKSGVGKSVFLEMCAGIITPAKGAIRWDGTSLGEMGKTELYDRREKIGYVFQVHALISNQSIYDNIALPLRYHSDLNEQEIKGKVRQVLDVCGLFNVDRSFPEALSAGQLRAAAIARALVAEPEVLLLDEPTSGIDPETEISILNVLREYQKQKNALLLMITDSTAITKTLATSVYVLDSGNLTNMESLHPEQGSELYYFISHFR
jgi:D-methionine transport system ATP-binding protein